MFWKNDFMGGVTCLRVLVLFLMLQRDYEFTTKQNSDMKLFKCNALLAREDLRQTHFLGNRQRKHAHSLRPDPRSELCFCRDIRCPVSSFCSELRAWVTPASTRRIIRHDDKSQIQFERGGGNGSGPEGQRSGRSFHPWRSCSSRFLGSGNNSEDSSIFNLLMGRGDVHTGEDGFHPAEKRTRRGAAPAPTWWDTRRGCHGDPLRWDFSLLASLWHYSLLRIQWEGVVAVKTNARPRRWNFLIFLSPKARTCVVLDERCPGGRERAGRGGVVLRSPGNPRVDCSWA